MGKAQKKTGKGRLDKYYKLAKEQGYRARSAFKLIQLNRKYSILENAKCMIDLCAAPGGWLQVASKYMPANSIIVGVDLVPIKPIPRAVTFTADITTPQCRNLIRNELKDWKADVVLHDGAPNVGTAWIQDAYSQSELVLMSLKLAVEFLSKGGTFVTKVFRSVDYNNLIWVFNQLFGKVEATKPPSSRNVSAEIFVVCREFLAPKFIDPKFLDPKHVFKDLSSSIEENRSINKDKAQGNVFHPEKKRRHRDGYADGDLTLFKTLPVSIFIHGHDPVSALGDANKITFLTDEEKEWLSLDITTDDVKANCEDLKVLGKGDFKTLIRWRLALREELGLDVKAKMVEDATEQETTVEVDEEQEISAELERLNTEAAARAKRERRKANEIKSKTIQRMQLQMVAPTDIGMEHQDFELSFGQDDVLQHGIKLQDHCKTPRAAISVVGQDLETSDGDEEEKAGSEEVLDSDEEKDKKLASLEAEMERMYETYQGRLRDRDSKFKVREARKNTEKGEWHGINESDDSADQEDEEEEEEEEEGGGWEAMQAVKFNEDHSSSDGSSDESGAADVKTRKRARLEVGAGPKGMKRQRLSPETSNVRRETSTAKIWFSQDIFGNVRGLDQLTDTGDDSDGSEKDEDSAGRIDLAESVKDDDDFEVVPQEQDVPMDLWDGDGKDQKDTVEAKIKKLGLTTPEAMTLAQQLVNREKTKLQLINDGFNRYSLNSKDGLPSWFLDDEAKHYKPNIPVTKEAMATLRTKQRALDARPIKKVAEAKARKKIRAVQRLEKAMKKAEGVNTTVDMSEREKAQAIEKLMNKGLSAGKKAKKEVKVVVAKGVHKAVKGRPRGVKGRYVMVDSRMKKELRSKKRNEKANRKR